MSKLYIAKNRYGSYYVKIVNKRTNCYMVVAANLPRGVDISVPYGTFDCDYYLSCYKTKTGDTALSINITKINAPNSIVVNKEINPSGTQSVNAYQDYNSTTPELPF